MNDEAIERGLARRKAVEVLLWASSGTVRHPTATCAPTSQRLCVCGLWDAIKLVDASVIGQMLRDWHDRQKLPL